ncbi:hypothetical protein E1262_20205 [Jiangella aurantiaca]|uniref:Uncharacterized protein n=1 Tax=Jiangella aurantiaca TaxID=2530373 RepID=A0A4R5A594_9ACTN|nr:hypothetical protein [Jiangella aurantiaca]TDD67101.1 hypothetical protein E1262_20205 [Jiangella aurantiaca]
MTGSTPSAALRRRWSWPGTPTTWAISELESLLDRAAADELMVVTTVTPHADRPRSYELLAGLLP